MRYLLIAVLTVLFLFPAGVSAWEYGQGTCADDIFCDSAREQREGVQRGWEKMRERNRRDWSLHLQERQERREQRRAHREYMDRRQEKFDDWYGDW